MNITSEIIQRKLIIPKLVEDKKSLCSNNIELVTSLDAALMSIGFKLSKECIIYLSKLTKKDISDLYYDNILKSIRNMVGDHIDHNTYFKEFPRNVPNTIEFWIEQIVKYILTGECDYGKYKHSYEDMLEHHDEFIEKDTDNITILRLGDYLNVECEKLYIELVKSDIPLHTEDIKILKYLTPMYYRKVLVKDMPIRETRAIVNGIKIVCDQIYIDTPTDIIRIYCYLSGGDITLTENTKFKSLPKRIRWKILYSLDQLICQYPDKIIDIYKYVNVWKRMNEKLHVFDKRYRGLSGAREFFSTLYKPRTLYKLEGNIQRAFMNGDIENAIDLLANRPGMLFRSVVRILECIEHINVESRRNNLITQLLELLKDKIKYVSKPVILSLLEALKNRETKSDYSIYINKKGTYWVDDVGKLELSKNYINKVYSVIHNYLYDTYLSNKNILIDKSMMRVAIPKTNKNECKGFASYPRGSVTTHKINIDNNSKLRFFIYWKEKHEITDYDLSVLYLDENFNDIGHISWTELNSHNTIESVHSGDITESKNGASEFIDIDVSKPTDVRYIIPSIHIYSGEYFSEVDECFFGYMIIDEDQKGKPFEPKTVKFKGDLFGNKQVSIPVVFDLYMYTIKAKWIHLYLNGCPRFNMVEQQYKNNSFLAKAFFEKEYFSVNDIYNIMLNNRTVKDLENKYLIHSKKKDNNDLIYVTDGINCKKDKILNEYNNINHCSFNSLIDIFN